MLADGFRSLAILTAIQLSALLNWLVRCELELVLDTIDIPNVPKSGPVSEIPIQASIGMALARYSRLQVSTKPFHGK